MIKSPFNSTWHHTRSGEIGLSDMKKFIHFHPKLSQHEKNLLNGHFEEVFKNKKIMSGDFLTEKKARESLARAYSSEIKKIHREKGEMFFDPSKEIIPKQEKAPKTVETKEVSKFKEEPKKSNGWLERLMGIRNKAEQEAKARGVPGSKNPYTEKDAELGGRKTNGANGRETQNPAPERHEGFSDNMPERESFHEAPPSSEPPMNSMSDFK